MNVMIRAGLGFVAVSLSACHVGPQIQDLDLAHNPEGATVEVQVSPLEGKSKLKFEGELLEIRDDGIIFSGADGNTIISKKRPVKEIDFGFVGDVKNLNINILKILLENNVTPIFCAITHDEKGQLLNTNADTIASELAIGFAEDFNVELYYCFEKKGVMKDVNDDSSVIKNINSKKYQALIDQGIIVDGMLPKLVNCFNAIKNNVKKVCIGKPEMLVNQNSEFTTIEI